MGKSGFIHTMWISRYPFHRRSYPSAGFGYVTVTSTAVLNSVVDEAHGTVQPNSAGELGTKDLYVGGLIVIHTFIASVWLLRLLS